MINPSRRRTPEIYKNTGWRWLLLSTAASIFKRKGAETLCQRKERWHNDHWILSAVSISSSWQTRSDRLHTTLCLCHLKPDCSTTWLTRRRAMVGCDEDTKVGYGTYPKNSGVFTDTHCTGSNNDQLICWMYWTHMSWAMRSLCAWIDFPVHEDSYRGWKTKSILHPS